MMEEEVQIVEEEQPVKATIDGKREVTVHQSVAAAVREARRHAPPLRGNGIFQHPVDWTQEEMDFIVDSLKKHIPIYVIAQNVHCERHTLSKLISNTPELRQLREDVYEDLWDETIYQTDRLMKTGNASVVLAMWDRLGARHGFGPTGSDGGGKGGGQVERIVMGVIPQEEVDAAEKRNEEIRKADPGAKPLITDPVALAAIEDTVKSEVERQAEMMKPVAIDAESVEVGAPAYGGEEGDFNGMIGRADGEDPWAAGAESPFFQ